MPIYTPTDLITSTLNVFTKKISTDQDIYKSHANNKYQAPKYTEQEIKQQQLNAMTILQNQHNQVKQQLQQSNIQIEQLKQSNKQFMQSSIYDECYNEYMNNPLKLYNSELKFDQKNNAKINKQNQQNNNTDNNVNQQQSITFQLPYNQQHGSQIVNSSFSCNGSIIQSSTNKISSQLSLNNDDSQQVYEIKSTTFKKDIEQKQRDRQFSIDCQQQQFNNNIKSDNQYNYNLHNNVQIPQQNQYTQNITQNDEKANQYQNNSQYQQYKSQQFQQNTYPAIQSNTYYNDSQILQKPATQIANKNTLAISSIKSIQQSGKQNQKPRNIQIVKESQGFQQQKVLNPTTRKFVLLSNEKKQQQILRGSQLNKTNLHQSFNENNINLSKRQIQQHIQLIGVQRYCLSQME